jgi:hypothetical protein
MAGERPAAANPGTTLSEHKGRWGVWAQGDCAFFEVRDGAEACELYRDALAHAQLGVSTHPPCVDGLRARRLADEVANLEVIRDTLTAEVERLRAARVGVCDNCYHVDAVYFDGEADVCVRFDVCQARQQVGRR